MRLLGCWLLLDTHFGTFLVKSRGGNEMLFYASKRCDLCGEDIAIKDGLFFRTINDYVTIPGREKRCGKSKWHYCYPCFFKVLSAARKEMQNERKAD